MIRSVLHNTEILHAIDAFHKRFRRWPRRDDGRIAGMLDTTWCGIDQALKKGHRGLPGGSSLPRFLQEHRGVRHRNYQPDLTETMIVRLAEEHRKRTGQWPNLLSGPVVGAPGETWLGIDKSLRAGRRSLSGGSSLGKLLASRRRVRNQTSVPKLNFKQILAWADAHFYRTGTWPTRSSGRIREAPAETWAAVDAAIIQCGRGLSGFKSLVCFLAEKRGVRNRRAAPDLVTSQIVKWAKDFLKQHGTLPKHISGPIPGSNGETWGSVHVALYHGRRGMAKSSLHLFLRKHFPHLFSGRRQRARQPLGA